jgi:hypothetical protein
MTTHWKAVLGVILIYVFGCFSGAFSVSIFLHHKLLNVLQHPGVALMQALEHRLTANLGLDPTQKEKVHDYFLENLQSRRELQKQIQPQVQALNQQTVQQITAILRPDQAQTFNDNLDRLRKRFGTLSPEVQSTSTPPSPIQPIAGSTNSAPGTPPAPH